MEELESQVAKIQIGNGKHVTSYVSILAEKAPAGNSELYVIAELPLFNPAAEESCEKICLAIGSTLKRTYRKLSGDSVFESAIAEINEELGKLAEMGQTHWIDKLNCVIAAKDGHQFSIATCGKVAAYLYRSEEFTDISCSPPVPHPLKTFENVAFGKLKLGDVVILSTIQLFNYISIDRLKNILSQTNFLHSARVIIEVLKENAGPEVAFGTIMNLQVKPGETMSEEVDLENYAAEPEQKISLLKKSLTAAKSALALDKTKRLPKVSLPQVSFSGSLKSVKDSTKTFSTKTKALFSRMTGHVNGQRKTLTLEQIRGFSKWKKIFLASLVILLVAVVAEIYTAAHLKKTQTAQTQITSQLKDAENLISNAESALLYKDDAAAKDYNTQAQSKLPSAQSLTQAQKTELQADLDRIAAVNQQLEKIVTPQVTNVGSLSQGSSLLALGNYLATQANSALVSYDKTTGKIEDGALQSSEKILSAAYVKNTTAVVYNGSGLLVWDYAKKQFSPPFTSSVPAEGDFVGLKIYATNSRAYLINKKTNQILSFLVGTTISKPIVYSKNSADLSNAIDLAVDGTVFVLNTGGVNQYRSGSLTNFALAHLPTPFSGKGKIATQADFKNIYVLDAGNNRILVFDKKGALLESLKAKEFTNLRDFQVDEKNKVIYALNDGSLLKIILP